MVLFFLVAASAPRAEACSFIIPWYAADPAEKALDAQAPGQVVVHSVEIRRGVDSGGCTSGSSCDDIGWLTLHVTPATDDRTPSARMGYLLRLASGKLPTDLGLPEEPLLASPSGETAVLEWMWADGTGEQESIDFALEVVAVDLAGNLGLPSSSVAVKDSGTGGCRVARRGGPNLGFAVLGLGVLLALRRRGT
jgi:hypothetical protein